METVWFFERKGVVDLGRVYYRCVFDCYRAVGAEVDQSAERARAEELVVTYWISNATARSSTHWLISTQINCSTAAGAPPPSWALEQETGVRSARMVDTRGPGAATVVGGRPDERLGRRFPETKRGLEGPRTRCSADQVSLKTVPQRREHGRGGEARSHHAIDREYGEK